MSPDLPLALVIPGLADSGPAHWQTRWEQERADCQRVEQRDWSTPDPDEWTGVLHRAVRAQTRPVVLVAHSLGCLLVDHAARHFGNWDGRVQGALLVAPCDPERPGLPDSITAFPVARQPLPFRTILVASSDDSYCSIERARCFANRWGASIVEVGARGHINADSALDSWAYGQVLLDELLARPAAPDRSGRLAALRAGSLSDVPAFGCNFPL